MKRLQDNKDESGPSFKDTEEFKSLIAQFNKIFKFWSKEGRKRKRDQHFEAKDNDMTFVNIWKNVDGQMKLTGNKSLFMFWYFDFFLHIAYFYLITNMVIIHLILCFVLSVKLAGESS